MAEEKEKLFDQFPPVSYQEWKDKVIVDLKGADFDKKLVWRTNEGFNVQPIYTAEDIKGLTTTDSLPGQFPFVRGVRTTNDWLTRQDILQEDVKEANKVAKDVLTKGVTSLGFFVGEEQIKDLPALLEGIDLKAVEINLNCCPKAALEAAKALVACVKAAGAEAEFKGSVNYNPLRGALLKGKEVLPNIAETAKALIEEAKDVPGLKVLAVDSVILNNAGCYIYQELGCALSWGAWWLTMLTNEGLKVDEVAKRIKFNMGVGSNYFMELAKFRAARMLWAEIVKAYNPECECACKIAVHAQTSRYNQTIYDAHVNLLRSQTEAMSAALAGVDSITVTPFDACYKTPDDFSERIARNQQFLLKEESHLDKVIDPAGGSYYVETLTVSLAKVAWKLFLELEEKGGFCQCVADGYVQELVNKTNEDRHNAVARRKEILLGTNQYPNINEKAADKIQKGECACHCSCAEGEKSEKALNMSREASQFEALRLATEHAANRPKVFMLTIGNLAMRLARAQFSTNFFGCAGYEIIDNLGFNTVKEGIDAALEKGADVVVLCSSDDEYATLAPEAHELLGDKAILVVAGAPACMDDLKAIGITEFIHVRVNVLDTLKAFNEKLLK